MQNMADTNFTKVPNLIIRDPRITPYAKAIYIALKSFSPSFPSYRRIMELTGINSRTTISSCIKILVTSDAVKISQNGPYKSNLYEFPGPSMDLNSPIVGLEIVHDVDTNKTNIKIPNNNKSEDSTDPPVESSLRSILLSEAESSLGPSAKYGYKEKKKNSFVIPNLK